MSKFRVPEKVHFIGIGGISMSALAKLTLLKGKKVTGSDLDFSKELETLIQWGAELWVGHSPEKIADTELVVYTSAVPADDPELSFAQERGIPTVERQNYLSALARECETVIAVAGTHGKTTTTAMLAHVFGEANAPFTAHIGGHLIGKGNMIYKGERFFITEACEFKRNFLALTPDVEIILNAEEDHPDTYKNEGEIIEAFEAFEARLPEKGGLLVLSRETDYYNMRKSAYAHMESYGFEGNKSYTINNVHMTTNGCFGFDILYNGIPKCEICLSVPGFHNIYNATAAYIVGISLGLLPETVATALSAFPGVERRFECKGLTERGARVIIDYAHHPTEIRSAIDTARSIATKKLITVFQPHTFSRTAGLFKEFLSSFDNTDVLFVLKEYSARETATQGSSAFDLYIELEKRMGGKVRYYDTLMPLAAAVNAISGEKTTILILGAGDVVTLADLITSS